MVIDFGTASLMTGVSISAINADPIEIERHGFWGSAFFGLREEEVGGKEAVG